MTLIPPRPQGFAALTLDTARLTLRPFREADAGQLFAIFSDPKVARYLSRPAWPEPAAAHARIARDVAGMANDEYICLAIERKKENDLIGECSLFSFMAQCRRAEIGYALARNAWGHGYMTEALGALIDFGFGELNLNRLEADIDPRNTASATSLERRGFRKEGHLRERWIVDGEVSDSGLYGLLATEWAASKTRYARQPAIGAAGDAQ
ncbi:MAG: GNAT family N-acetyltransferase [Casimicrobiaceae bacterium]